MIGVPKTLPFEQATQGGPQWHGDEGSCPSQEDRGLGGQGPVAKPARADLDVEVPAGNEVALDAVGCRTHGPKNTEATAAPTG